MIGISRVDALLFWYLVLFLYTMIQMFYFLDLPIMPGYHFLFCTFYLHLEKTLLQIV